MNPAMIKEFQKSIRRLLKFTSDIPQERLRLMTLFPEWTDEQVTTILEVNQALRQENRNFNDGQDRAIRETWPAQELITEDSSLKEAWRLAGGHIVDGRYVASKDSPIWCKISVFNLPHPPFHHCMATSVQDVTCSDGLMLGVIVPDYVPISLKLKLPDRVYVLEADTMKYVEGLIYPEWIQFEH